MKWLWCSLLVVVLDQLSKVWAVMQLPLHSPQPVFPSLNMTLAYNRGAAFSFLSDASGWQRWFFAVLAIVVSIAIIFWLRRLRSTEKCQGLALSLILGGALGNVWDRIQLGYVVDFIDVYYGAWHWPVFNIADSAITVGAVLLIVDAFIGKRSEVL